LSTFAAVVVSRPRLLLSCLSFLAVYSLVKLPCAALAAPRCFARNTLLSGGVPPAVNQHCRCCPPADRTPLPDKNSPLYRAASMLTPSLPFELSMFCPKTAQYPTLVSTHYSPSVANFPDRVKPG